MGSNDQRSTIRKVAVSSFLGNFIEWFDYATYSYFAVVIANVFFPGDDPALALMQTFAVFALSFLLRPIGAIFWGSMGDKKGRKWALSTSIFLMTGATFCIGLLPGYLAIGLAAPILLLLLRMIQGFSASGEYAGAATFLAEYAPSDKRGVYCSLVPASTAVGLLVGSTFATVMYTILPDAAVNEWGWRIPFLLAGPLGLVAHYIRTKLEDSPTYQEMQAAISKTDDSNHPIRDLFRHHTKELIISFGAAMLNAVGFYVVLTYLPVYLETVVMMPANESSLITTICLVAYVAFIFGMGHLSDKFRAQEDAHHRLCVVHRADGAGVHAVEHCAILHGAGRRAGAVPGAYHQRRYAVQLSDRDVPDGGALHRLRPVVQLGERPVRRFRLVHLDCSDRRYRLRSRACLVHGRRVLCRAGGDDTIARTYG